MSLRAALIHGYATRMVSDRVPPRTPKRTPLSFLGVVFFCFWLEYQLIMLPF